MGSQMNCLGIAAWRLSGCRRPKLKDGCWNMSVRSQSLCTAGIVSWQAPQMILLSANVVCDWFL